MKKALLVVALVFGVLSASVISAQDGEEVPASCEVDALTEAATVISEGFTEYQELMTLPEEPTASDLSMAVAIADAYAYGFWEGLYENEEDTCLEVWWLGYNGGLLLDEALIVTQLSALATHEAEAGNIEVAETLLAFATDRSAMLESEVETLEATLAAVQEGEPLDVEITECTEEELTETWEGLTTITEVYEELSTMAEEDGELTPLIAGYAALSNGYWNEVYPLVPACYEASDAAFTVGLIIDESLIVVSNLRLAEIEAEAGNEELAQALVDSATVRAEELTAAIEEYFGTEEEE